MRVSPSSRLTPLIFNLSYPRRVTGAPSGKTSFVILGEGAGPKKLADIKRLGLQTLDEDGFLNLIGTRKGELDAKSKEKLRKEKEQMKKEVAEMEKRERESQSSTMKSGTGSVIITPPLMMS